MGDRKFVVNGKEYASIEEVPEEYRALVKEAQEKSSPSGPSVHFSVHKTFKFKVNGKEYGSVDEMPDAVRRVFADRNGNGVPDILENLPGADASSTAVRKSPVQVRPKVSVLIKEESSSKVFLAVVIFAAAGMLVYFLYLK